MNARMSLQPNAPKARRRHARGFTLVELLVVITLMGVMASLGATFVGRIVSGMQDTRARLNIAQSADAALARMSDELSASLPNSVRAVNNAAGMWVEWVPVVDAGRYRQAPDTVSGNPGDMFDPTDATDHSFDVIGSAVAATSSGQKIVFSNMGTPDSDVYSGNNRRSGVTLTGNGTNVAFTAGALLPASTTGGRFFIVGSPVSLGCSAGATAGTFDLTRYSNYGWQTNQPVAVASFTGGTATLVLSGLKSCTASYNTALANIGLLNLRLTAGDVNTAVHMDIVQQVAIDNTP